VGANGGMLSKHSVGVYSTRPVDRWQPLDCAKAQAAIDALPAPGFIQAPEGIGVIESYTVIPGQPTATAIVLARLQQTGARFCAASEPGAGTGEQMLAEDPLGAEIVVTPGERGNRFRLASG
jgi:acetyl-CoA C-acetyltransferase